jgi:putative DNA primase/helicase
MEPLPEKDRFEEIRKLVEQAYEEERQVYPKPLLLLPAPSAPVLSALSSQDILDALRDNEDGDARLFIALNKNKILFDHSTDRWYRWSGHYWGPDEIGNFYPALEPVIQKYLDEALRQAQARQAAVVAQNTAAANQAKRLEDDLLKRVFNLQTVYRKKNVLFLSAQGDDSLGISGDEWDRDPLLLGCSNGVIELKTGLFRPGRPEDYIKTIAPTEWKGIDNQAPTWERFLSEIFDGNMELVEYVQRLFGYSITGLTVEHILPILWGEGRNGKGTMLETLGFVLGNLAKPIQAEMLMRQGRLKSSAGPSPDIMSLRGRRLAWGSETDEGVPMDLAKVKYLTGGDTLVGRPPHGRDMIEFSPTHTLFLLTNHKPEIPTTESGIWERVHLIPFTLKFVDEPREPNERQRDPFLPEKLKAEAPGILAWLVKGCLEWQRAGLNPPSIVKETTAEYRRDEDILSAFIQEVVIINVSSRVKAGEFYKAYEKWCLGNGHKPMGGKKFGERMGKIFKKRRDSKGNYYEGIELQCYEADGGNGGAGNAVNYTVSPSSSPEKSFDDLWGSWRSDG